MATPGVSYLESVASLCRATAGAGTQVADARHAPLVFETGATWVTRDSDFARFEPHGLHWQHLALD